MHNLSHDNYFLSRYNDWTKGVTSQETCFGSDRSNELFCSPNLPGRLWAPTNILFNTYWGTFPGAWSCQLILCNAGFKNNWSLTFTFTFAVMPCTGITFTRVTNLNPGVLLNQYTIFSIKKHITLRYKFSPKFSAWYKTSSHLFFLKNFSGHLLRPYVFLFSILLCILQMLRSHYLSAVRNVLWRFIRRKVTMMAYIKQKMVASKSVLKCWVCIALLWVMCTDIEGHGKNFTYECLCNLDKRIKERPTGCNKWWSIGNQLFLNTFRAFLCPSSGQQTASHCLRCSVL